VTKADQYMEAGLSVEKRGGGSSKFYVSHISGLCRNIPLQVGDQLLKLNDVELHKNPTVSLKQVRQLIEDDMRLEMVVRRCDPNDNQVFDEAEVGEDDDDSEGGDMIGEFNDANSYEENEDDEDEDYDSSEVEYGQFNEHAMTTSHGGPFQPGSAARLTDLDSVKPSLNGQTVSVKHESAKKPGMFECELQDGSRVSVSQKNLDPISEQEQDDFQPYIPGSARSLAFCNLIEAGDVMKIRGLKKQAKMNGTMVEILRPSESQPGRWECVLCDDKDRVIAVMSENLRHI
ncbi:MAG: hypothetical protein SGARI_008108, partial [Bacillariaceae sp.]